MSSLSRRHVLAGGGLALLGCRPASAPVVVAKRRIPTFPATDIAVKTDYPAMSLLTDETYKRRRARLKELGKGLQSDSIFVSSGGANFSYLVGADFGRSERLIAIVVPLDGAPVLFAPSFEVARIKQRARAIEIRGWEESEDPIAKMKDLFGKNVLIEPHTDYSTAAAIGRLGPVKLIDGTKAFDELRSVKSDEEMARMQRAVIITEDAFAAVFDQLEVGMKEKDVSKLCREEQIKRGGDGGYALVQFGTSAALPHGGPTSAPLAENTVVLIDGGCSFQGWQSDITRTRWFGRSNPSDRFRTIYNLVHDAQTAAIQAVRPGVAAQEIDRAARAVITRGGFGAAFTHRLGHGIGMEGHEPVYMVEGNERLLEPGLVFSVEPGIYLENELGVRLEDQVACGTSAATVLSRRAPRL